MEGFLYYCKVASKDVKNSYEDTICIISYFVPRDIGMSKCNLHLLWVATVFGFVIISPSVPNLGYCSSYYRYLIIGGQTMHIKSFLGILLVVKYTCICFQLMHFSELKLPKLRV
jgi:hypothetical protein